MSTVDPEMLKNLGLLLDYDELQNPSLWDEFVKNFDQIMDDKDLASEAEEDELSPEGNTEGQEK